MKSRYLLALILLIPNLCLSQAKPSIVATIDDIANAALQQGPIAGMSIAVVRGNQTLLLKGYGNSNVELTTATTPDTVYHIDSITKNMTSAGMVQLVEQHKLTLDDLAEKYVPEIHAIAPAATVRSLMNHTSGIPDYTDLGPKSENIEAVKFTHRQFLATIQDERSALPACAAVAIQQLRFLFARNDHRESLGRNVWRLHAEPHLQAAWHGLYPLL